MRNRLPRLVPGHRRFNANRVAVEATQQQIAESARRIELICCDIELTAISGVTRMLEANGRLTSRDHDQILLMIALLRDKTWVGDGVSETVEALILRLEALAATIPAPLFE